MRIRRLSSLGFATFLGVASLVSAPAVQAADPVVVGAGDIGDCDTTTDTATSRLLAKISGTVITLGDNAYSDGTTAEFRDCYGPTWGKFKSRTRPAPGNHDYKTSDAKGYFDYFGWRAGSRANGYYAYKLGTWHVIVLNSNCGDVSCAANSAQVKWLKYVLAKTRGRNVLAYWHHPRFSSGRHGNDDSVQAFWDALYAEGADIVLNGHDHDYERFYPQTPAGEPDRTYGIRQFVVGTGGTSLRSKGTTQPNSQVFSSTHGVLSLRLRADSYVWKFTPIAGKSFTDTGSQKTHGPPPASAAVPLTPVATTRATLAVARDVAMPEGGSATRASRPSFLCAIR
jgi:hypothetical protein